MGNPSRLKLCKLMRLLTMAATLASAHALRKVLITGANKGIGKRIAERVLADVDDAYVYLGARDAGRGAAAVESIVAAHPSAAGRIERAGRVETSRRVAATRAGSSRRERALARGDATAADRCG